MTAKNARVLRPERERIIEPAGLRRSPAPSLDPKARAVTLDALQQALGFNAEEAEEALYYAQHLARLRVLLRLGRVEERRSEQSYDERRKRHDKEGELLSREWALVLRGMVEAVTGEGTFGIPRTD